MERLTIGAIDGEIVTFTDTFQVSGARDCTCPFFLQYSAPCAHLWKIAGEAAADSFHPAWKVGTGPAPQAAIVYGPWNKPKVSMEDAKHNTYLDMIADLQAKLLDLGMDAGMPFIKKFSSMIDRGTLNSPRTIFFEMMSTSTDGKPSRSHPNTPTSRLARSAITSRQLLEDAANDSDKKSHDNSMTAALLGSPMATATTITDEFAGELPPPPSSPAISYADMMEQLDESNFTFRKSHAGVLTLRQQEKVCVENVYNHRSWMKLKRKTLT